MFLSACTVDQVLSDIDLALQIAASLAPAVGTLSPADAAIITTFTTLGHGGIVEIENARAAWIASGTASDLAKLQAVIAEVKANLANELATAHISDPKTVTTVTNWVNLLVSAITAIAVALPQVNTSAELARVATVTIPTPEELQARWTTEVCQGDSKCSSLVKVHHKRAKGRGFWSSLGNAIGEAKFGQ